MPGGEDGLLLQLDVLTLLAGVRTVQQELASERQLCALLRCATDVGAKRQLLRRWGGGGAAAARSARLLRPALLGCLRRGAA
jgi:hypothetical protein